jgi:hypothetical protein
MDQAVVEQESRPLWTHLLKLAPKVPVWSRLVSMGQNSVLIVRISVVGFAPGSPGLFIPHTRTRTGTGGLLAIAKPMSTMGSTGSPQCSVVSGCSTAWKRTKRVRVCSCSQCLFIGKAFMKLHTGVLRILREMGWLRRMIEEWRYDIRKQARVDCVKSHHIPWEERRPQVIVTRDRLNNRLI